GEARERARRHRRRRGPVPRAAHRADRKPRVIVFGAIAPHGDVDEPPELLAAMEELGRRFDSAAPDATIVVTPHNVHVEGHFAVVVAGKVRAWEAGREWDTDRELAGAVLAALRNEGLPAVGISFGGNDAAGAEHPSDWGT